MSVINSNPFGPELAAPAIPQFELGGSAGGGSPQLPSPSDSIYQSAPPAGLPIQSPLPGLGACIATPASGSGSFQGGFGSILTQISNAIANLFAQLGAAFGSTSSGTQSSTGSAAAPGAETAFASATASSAGDPHLTLDGTTSAGDAVQGKWDSMRSHADLLDSDSFAGGYRIATQVTQPNAKGVTLNASASIATAGGATSVSMQAGGSYAVSENGTNVVLQQGQATALGNGESVTLNADGSLTVSDRNGSGGSIATTLKSNGDGGVDVSTQASRVDLGGYLVNHTDAPSSAPNPAWNGAAAVSLTQPAYAASLGQFDPDAAETSLQNIAL